jgi:uncharacterized protein (TIGR00251 family)
MGLWIHENDGGILFKILVQPRSSKNQIVGLHGDAIKVKITAPPVEGKANRACEQFVAKILRVPRSSVTIVAGHTGRSKQVLVSPGEDKAPDSLKKQIISLI